MRKTAIGLMILLLLSTILPYNVFANSGDNDPMSSNLTGESEDAKSDQQEEVPEEDPNIGKDDSENVPDAEDSQTEEQGEVQDPDEDETTGDPGESDSEKETSVGKDGNGEDLDGEEGEEQENSMMMRSAIQGSKTSRLGHLHANVKIYKKIGDASTINGNKYTNAVYYIKKQANVSGQIYYLLSSSPSSTKGVVGWAKASDLSTHSHVGVNRNSKTLYIKGTGNSYSKAWGGSKDNIYNLSNYKGQTFKVHLTEKVGNNTWYRGTLNGTTTWIHSSYLTNSIESSTSMLGHIRSSSAKIYSSLNENASFTTSTSHTNAVYYIKKQAKQNEQTYYFISTQPSSTKGGIGWLKAGDMSTHSHVGVDKASKTLYFTGNGSAYSKAWGGNKDIVEKSMSKYKGEEFQVHLTEKVGNNTWYRGTFDGKTIWLHSSYLTTKTESNVSRLGHLRANVKIYKNIGDNSSTIDGNQYTSAVYYIKKQAEVSGQKYYLISTSPSSTKHVVGWVKSGDLSTHQHVGIDKEEKTFYFKGTGSAYSKAWGGPKDIVHQNMSAHKGQVFKVDLTEKVGNNTWYRGSFKDQRIWLHSSYVDVAKTTDYNLTLKQAVEVQMKATPQTDKKYAWVSKAYINKSNKVTASSLNVRSGPSASHGRLGIISNGTTVKVLDEHNGWYAIEYGHKKQWVHASPKDVSFYLNPLNFINDSIQRFQFLNLGQTSGASEAVLNNYLQGKGTLSGQGKAFINAGNQHGVNDVYLISHSILETGNGGSTLAKGVKFRGKIVYNMYGIGAYDDCPVECGAVRAYDEGWTSPEKAIIGGAEFIRDKYVKAGQNTLYKMRWNYAQRNGDYVHSHQYATDVGWASKQVRTMHNLYKEIGFNAPSLDIPVYK